MLLIYSLTYACYLRRASSISHAWRGGSRETYGCLHGRYNGRGAHRYIERGSYSLAEPLCRQLTQSVRQKFGDAHQETFIAIGSLINVLEGMGKYNLCFTAYHN